MGGRGSSSTAGGSITTAAGNTAPALDKDLVDRANAAGLFIDYGDSAVRMYSDRVDEINSMDLTAAEKQAAIEKLHELTTAQLKAESKSFSPYSMSVGPARFDANKMRKASDKAVKAKSETDSHMNGLREAQRQKAAKAETQNLTGALGAAQKSGSLETTYNGKSYFRTSKSSGTWREGTLKDYKAEQKYKKALKNVPFSQHKAWSSLSAAEKAKYYK